MLRLHHLALLQRSAEADLDSWLTVFGERWKLRADQNAMTLLFCVSSFCPDSSRDLILEHWKTYSLTWVFDKCEDCSCVTGSSVSSSFIQAFIQATSLLKVASDFAQSCLSESLLVCSIAVSSSKSHFPEPLNFIQGIRAVVELEESEWGVKTSGCSVCGVTAS